MLQPPPLVIAPPPAWLQAVQAADAAGRHADAVALLRQAADAGHASAMSFLGARLLIGRGAAQDAGQAFPLLVRAGELGEADTHLILAAVMAASAATPAHWDAVLERLQRAAELHSPRARGQLLLLSGHVGRPPADPGLWARLRRSVNAAAWLRPPPKRVLSEAPRIRVGSASCRGRPATGWCSAPARSSSPPPSTIPPRAPRARRPRAATARWSSTRSPPT